MRAAHEIDGIMAMRAIDAALRLGAIMAAHQVLGPLAERALLTALASAALDAPLVLRAVGLRAPQLRERALELLPVHRRESTTVLALRQGRP
jgi:hypothetical protein